MEGAHGLLLWRWRTALLRVAVRSEVVEDDAAADLAPRPPEAPRVVADEGEATDPANEFG